MAETVYKGQIKTIQGKLQVTNLYANGDDETVVRKGDLTELNPTKLKVVEAKVTDNLEITGKLTVTGKNSTGENADHLTVQSIAEATINATEKTTISAPTIQLVTKGGTEEAKKEASIKTLTDATSNPQIEIEAPIITLKIKDADTAIALDEESDSISLQGSIISLAGTATTSTEITLKDTLSNVQSESSSISPEDEEADYIVNNTTLHDYNNHVDAKIRATKAELQVSIKDIKANLGTKPDDTNTVWKEIKDIKDNISNGLHFRGVVTNKNNVDNPKSGDLIIIGTQEYVYNGTEWQELGDENTHATKTELTEGLKNKVDLFTYNTKAAQFEATMTNLGTNKVNTTHTGNVSITGTLTIANSNNETLNGVKVPELKLNENLGTDSSVSLADTDTSKDFAINKSTLYTYNDHVNTKIKAAKKALLEILSGKNNVYIMDVQPENTLLGSSNADVTSTTFGSNETNSIPSESEGYDSITLNDLQVGDIIIVVTEGCANRWVSNIITNETTNKTTIEFTKLGLPNIASTENLKKTNENLTGVANRVTALESKLPSQNKLDTGLFGELEADENGNLTGALIIRTIQKPATVVNGINNNEVY